MPIGSAQWANLAPETTWGTYDSAAAVDWLNLMEGNSLHIEPDPKVITLRTAGSGNLRNQDFFARTGYPGRLSIAVQPDQAIRLIPWAFSPSGTAPNLTLPSFTANFFDGVESRRAVGGIVLSGSVSTDNSRDYMRLDYQLLFQKVTVIGGGLAAPAFNLLPIKRPYIHTDSKGLVTIGSLVTIYSGLTVNVRNQWFPDFGEDQYLMAVDYCGRDVDWTISKRVTSNVFRLAVENQTVQTTCNVQWDVTVPTWGAAHSLRFNLRSANYIPRREVNRDFDKAQYETLSFEAFRDPATGDDMLTVVS
jgi:hypothetical protein